MNKAIVFACLFMLVSCSADVEPSIKDKETVSTKIFKISEEEAVRRLEKVLQVFDTSTRTGRRTIKEIIPRLNSKTRTYTAESLDTLMYVVNFDDNNGYAVVAADERINDFVLALIDTGNYEPSSSYIPSLESLSNDELYELLNDDEKDDFWCGRISPSDLTIPSIEMIEDYLISEMQNVEYKITRIDTIATETKKGPFLKTKWEQDAPYNWMCHFCINGHFHLDANEDNCPTGCGATALAQVLSYHKYPKTVDNHIYNWDILHQRERFYVNDAIEDIAEVAYLMKDAGLACFMDYRLDVSLTTAKKIQKALDLTFKYRNTDKINSFAEAKIISSLNMGTIPIVFGLAKGKKIGHIWVVDGYHKYKFTTTEITYRDSTYSEIISEELQNSKEKYYYHCNYGWGGIADGYYLGEIFSTKHGADFIESEIDEPYRGVGGSNYTRHFRTVIYGNPN